MNHEERMARADVNGSSEFYFSYVLQFDDGTFYVGHTNAPAARWTEHAAGQSVAILCPCTACAEATNW